VSLLTDRIDAGLLDAAPRLKVVSNYAVGFNNVDVAAATARGVAVGNTPGVLTDATADLAFALLMAAARKLPEADAAVREGDWKTWEPERYLGADVHGATLGIIGWADDHHGTAVARTMGVTSFAIANIFLSYTVKDPRESLFTFTALIDLKSGLASLATFTFSPPKDTVLALSGISLRNATRGFEGPLVRAKPTSAAIRIG